jgi:ribosomal protein S18 acetylase RimI-like enzyme
MVMDVRSLGYRTDLMVRRLSGAEIVDRGEYLVVRTPRNPTFYWGNFVLFARPAREGEVEERLAVFAREHPDAAHVAIGVDDADGRLGAEAEFAAAGVVAERFAVLAADRLREPPMPNAEATCRPLRDDDDWRQALELRLAVADEEGEDSPTHVSFIERSVDEARSLAETGYGWRFGAFVDGRLGSSLGVVLDADGLARYQTVETHPALRRQGLASMLVHSAGQRAFEAGARTLVIAAVTDGPAIGIYRALGFAAREHQGELLRRPG